MRTERASYTAFTDFGHDYDLAYCDRFRTTFAKFFFSIEKGVILLMVYKIIEFL